MSIIARLLPREDKFHSLLGRLASEAGASARHLKDFIEGKDRARAAAAIKASKDEAKRVKNEITAELCRSFITPFDREDIQDFARNIYKIPKTVGKVCEFVENHNLTTISDLAPQTDVIVQEAAAMESMVQALVAGGKSAEVAKQAALLDELENKGDAIVTALLSDLIKNTSDARQLILKKDIYDLLERIIDKYRNAAEIALQISLKHN